MKIYLVLGQTPTKPTKKSNKDVLRSRRSGRVKLISKAAINAMNRKAEATTG